MFITARGNGFQLWILLLDGVVELGEPSIVGRIAVGAGAVKPIFVSDLHILHLEGQGMPVLGALCAPFCGLSVPDEILDFLERFLNVGFQFRTSPDDATPAEAVAGKDAEQRFHVKILAPLSEFEQPEAVGGPVTPGTGMARALFDRANGFLPIEPLIEGVALKIIAAGESEEFGLHGSQQFHDIGAVAVLAIIVAGRKE